MRKLWARLLHNHKYVQTGFKQAEDANVRYSIRKYECEECGNVKWVDGRIEDYFNRN